MDYLLLFFLPALVLFVAAVNLIGYFKNKKKGSVPLKPTVPTPPAQSFSQSTEKALMKDFQKTKIKTNEFGVIIDIENASHEELRVAFRKYTRIANSSEIGSERYEMALSRMDEISKKLQNSESKLNAQKEEADYLTGKLKGKRERNNRGRFVKK